MGDARDELSDRGHPLRNDRSLSREAPLLGHVAMAHDAADECAIGFAHRTRPALEDATVEELDVSMIDAHPRVTEVLTRLRLQHVGILHERLGERDVRRDLPGRDHLVGHAPHLAEASVACEHQPVEIADEDAVGDGVLDGMREGEALLELCVLLSDHLRRPLLEVRIELLHLVRRCFDRALEHVAILIRLRVRLCDALEDRRPLGGCRRGFRVGVSDS